jgi:hypothetical protein
VAKQTRDGLQRIDRARRATGCRGGFVSRRHIRSGRGATCIPRTRHRRVVGQMLRHSRRQAWKSSSGRSARSHFLAPAGTAGWPAGTHPHFSLKICSFRRSQSRCSGTLAVVSAPMCFTRTEETCRVAIPALCRRGDVVVVLPVRRLKALSEQPNAIKNRTRHHPEAAVEATGLDGILRNPAARR